jgi:hypothetical protein
MDYFQQRNNRLTKSDNSKKLFDNLIRSGELKQNDPLFYDFVYHRINSIANKFTFNEIVNTDYFRCPFRDDCGVLFCQQDMLKEHLRTVHKHQIPKGIFGKENLLDIKTASCSNNARSIGFHYHLYDRELENFKKECNSKMNMLHKGNF